MQHGAVVVNIKDDFGNMSVHTLYLATVGDVYSAVAQLLSETDANSTALRERMMAAGWKP